MTNSLGRLERDHELETISASVKSSSHFGEVPAAMTVSWYLAHSQLKYFGFGRSPDPVTADKIFDTCLVPRASWRPSLVTAVTHIAHHSLTAGEYDFTTMTRLLPSRH